MGTHDGDTLSKCGSDTNALSQAELMGKRRREGHDAYSHLAVKRKYKKGSTVM